MISFDMKSLLTSVPLEETINVASDRIYHRKEIDTSITKNDMHNLLLLYTKMSTFVLVVTYINKMIVQQ